MTDFFKRLELASVNDRLEEFYSQYSFDEICLTAQIDWAVDDVNDPVSGWHYNAYWDYNREYGFGLDETGALRTGAWDEVEKIRPEAVPNPDMADVDGDNKITSTDARIILQYSVKKIDRFPVKDIL